MIEFKQIICPVDFCESSVRAFAHAAAIARWYDAQLTVLHVVPTFEPIQVRGDLGDPVRVVTPMPREQVLEEMSRTLNVAAVSPRATPIAEAGDPQTTIVADLLLADGKIDARERKFLHRLAVDFSIRARVASHVVEAMLVKNCL